MELIRIPHSLPGLYSTNDVEAAQIDMILGCSEDMIAPYLSIQKTQDEEQKQSLQKKYEDEQLPQWLSSLEKILKQNGDGNFFVGNRVR